MLLLLAVFAMLGGMQVAQSLDQAHERLDGVGQRLLHQAQLMAAHQQYLVARADSLLAEMLVAPAAQSEAAPADCAAWMALRLQETGDFVQMGRLLPSGQLDCAAMPPKEPVSFADRSWFLRAVQSRDMIVGDVVTGRVLGRPVITMARASRDDNGRVKAVLFVTLDKQWLQRMLAEATMADDARFWVVDSSGTIVVRYPDPEGISGRSEAGHPLVRTVLAQPGHGVLQAAGLDGKPRLVAHVPLVRTVGGALKLVLTQESAAVTAPVYRAMAERLALVGLFAALTFALALWSLERLVLLPVRLLSENAALLGKERHSVDTRLQRRSDDLGRLAVALDAAGMRIRELLLARDAAERALQDNVDRLQLLIDHVPAALALFDREMRYLGVSRRWRDDYRIGDIPLIGRLHYDVLRGIPEHWREVNRRALAGEVVACDEDSFVRTDGERRWVRWEVRPWHAAEGSVGGIVIFSEDITARRQAGEALDASERRFTATFEQAAVGLALVSPDGRWLRVNHKLCEIVGYEKDELLATSFQRITHPEDLQSDLGQVQRMLAREIDHYSLLKRYLRKGGEAVWINLSVALVWTTDGKPDYFISAIEDVDDKHRMQLELEQHRAGLERLVEQRTAQLREAQSRAEAANLAKSAFLANMSHEIRTPLNAIIGLTHLLKLRDPTPAQASHLGKIEASSRHLLTLISDVLDLSKIEAGKLTLEAREFALEQVVDHVWSVLGESAEEKGVAMAVSTEGAPNRLRGDDTRLRQALLNLVSNAVKFTPPGGQVDVHVELLDSVDERVLLRFTVRDTGIGIAADRLEGLFTDFTQADDSTTRRFGGTGLGLAIARRLAQLMQGDIGVDSRPGEGSRFWFTAWLGRGHELEEPPLRAVVDPENILRRRHAGARVLLAEDNAVNVEVALALLHSVGLQVDVATNGREAVQHVVQTSYDLVLMDMQMPEMDGPAAAREIRLMPGRASLPIVAMTANAFDDDRMACMAAGMNDFVSKPVAPEDLYATIVRWLDPADTPVAALTSADCVFRRT